MAKSHNVINIFINGLEHEEKSCLYALTCVCTDTHKRRSKCGKTLTTGQPRSRVRECSNTILLTFFVNLKIRNRNLGNKFLKIETSTLIGMAKI